MSASNEIYSSGDAYDRYNDEVEKYLNNGHSGKNRTKQEARAHTNHNDPCGHSRKILTKLINTEHNKRDKK